MSKRWITVLLTALTVILLTGCNADQKAVEETAKGFLDAIVANDKKTAAQYATEEFMESEVMKLMDPEYLSDAFYAKMNVQKEDLDEEAIATVDAYVQELVARAYKDYEIQDIKVKEDTAAITAKITLGYDPDASSQIPEETAELISQYQSEHYDELVGIYTEEGEKAMYRKLYSDLIPIVIGKMHEQLENNGTSEEKTVLTLEKIDGKWLVTALEENRASAAEAVSAQEAAAAEATTAESASEYSTKTEYAEEGSTSNEYASEDGTYEEAADEETSE